VIFYYSKKRNPKLAQQQQFITVRGEPRFIRVETVDVTDLIEALDLAKPQRGENVMNTHWF